MNTRSPDTVEEEDLMALRKKQTLLDQASSYVDKARPQVESAVTSALDAVEDFYENTARPALVDVKEKAAPTLAEARDKAAPLVAGGAAKAADVAAQAKEAADAKVAQLRGEEPKKKKGSKLRKLAFFAALAGAVGFVAKKLQAGSQADNWQSSYVPSPAPAAAPTPRPDDAGAAGPDEALSDAADEPHASSTPDQPAEVVDLETPAEDSNKS
jgi:hypothetical protein